MFSRHCERSEAIQKATKEELDCFVATAPRNDEGGACALWRDQ
jgi:hypothetical protein